jgi:hypothetical protein
MLRPRSRSARWLALLWLGLASTRCTPPLDPIEQAGDDAASTSTGVAGGGGASPTTTTTTTTSGGGDGAGGTGQAGAGGTGGGVAVECTDPAVDCDPPSGPCLVAVCEDGQCAEALAPVGTPIADQVSGDCLEIQCFADGSTAAVADDTDVPDDGHECTTDGCVEGIVHHDPLAASTGCSEDGGAYCDGAGACVECVTNAQCATNYCDSFTCVAASCGDGVKNGSETDVDCGGACAACGPGAVCLLAADCASHVCTGLVCQAPACGDGVKNGTESDVDCGGACADCPPGSACAGPNDCSSQVCSGGTCLAPSCFDGVKNGQEIAIDCGGPVAGCVGCGDGTPCGAAAECAGAVCASGLCCTPDAMAVTCAGKCGNVVNDCGQQVACGGCVSPQTCGGGGTPNVCGCAAGCPNWAKIKGDGADQSGQGVAVDGAGNVYVTGSFQGTIDLGGGPLTSAGGDDVFIAKLDSSGDHVWSKRFGNGASQNAAGVAVDSSGNVLLVGSFYGTIDFGGGSLTTAGGTDVYVAKLDSAGNHVWSKRFGDASTQTCAGVAVDGSGFVAIAGSFAGVMDFSGTTLTSVGANDAYVARFGSNGSLSWAKRFGDAQDQQARAVATDSAGNVFVAGSFLGTVDFGGGVLTSAGNEDAFAAKLSAGGVYQWAKRFGDNSPQIATGIAVDPAGGVALAGYFGGSIDLGGGALASAGAIDVFVAKLSSATGAYSWAKRFGDASAQEPFDVAADASGNVLVTGKLAGAADFGGGSLSSAGLDDVFIAKLDLAGAHVWSKRAGDANSQYGTAIAADGSGNAIVTGVAAGSLDFGLGSLTSAGGADLFLAKFGP